MSNCDRELERLQREARKAAGIAEPKTVLELVEPALPKAMQMLEQIATACADPKLRLDACKYLTELGETARKEKAKRDEQYYGGNALILEALTAMPQGEQRSAALQMFARQQMSRNDLEAVLKLIDTQAQDRISALIAENEQLVKVIEGEQSIKTVGMIVNGTALVQ